MNFCKKCNFDTERTNQGGCKPCKKAADAARYKLKKEECKASNYAWREANNEKYKAGCALYRLNNKEVLKEKHAIWQKEAYLQNPEKFAKKHSLWRCKNKEKINAYQAVWREKNKDKCKEYKAKWASSNKPSRRINWQNYQARKSANGGTLSKGLSERLFILQKGRCACCSLPLGGDYHIDHIVPVSLGGSNTDDNIQLLRASCNTSKKDKHPIDFMQSKGFLL